MMNNMGMVDNNYYYYNNNNNNSYNNNNNININNPPPPPPPPGYWSSSSSSSSWDLHHRHEHNHNHNHNNNNNNNQNPRKRPFDFIPHPTPPPPPPHQDCKEDGVGFVKVYVAGIPITCTHLQIRSLFELYGNIVEIIILNDKRTGLQRECCFIKFTTLEEAERAIGALNNQYYFPGATLPIKVRYAEGERERFSQTGNHVLKLYVNGLHKQASKMDIGEIFSTYGIVEDIHIVRDEFNQSRGMGFVQFARRDMAIAAINSLNGIFFMEGCDQPLIVRFAEPKKPRSNYKFGGAAVGSHFQEPPVRPPVPYLNESMVGSMPSNVTGRFSPKTTPSSSQSPRIGGKSDTVSSSSSVSEASDSFDCDWSEHICPDGYKYYYNCVSCESRWEKPQEYSLFEQQLQKEHTCQQQQQCSGSHKQSRSPSAPQINFSVIFQSLNLSCSAFLSGLFKIVTTYGERNGRTTSGCRTRNGILCSAHFGAEFSSLF